MRKFLNVCVVFILLMGISVYAQAAGEGHHPNWHRYGYVDIPLTAFTTRDYGTTPETRDTSDRLLNETTFEGIASKNEAVITRDNGFPAIALGPTDKEIETAFHVPKEYWRGGTIKLVTRNTNTVGEDLKWSVRILNDSTEDTTDSVETDVTTSSPSSGTVTETLEFVPTEGEGEGSIKEDSIVSFKLNKKNAGPNCGGYPCSNGTLFIKKAYFEYEKKTDS